jgi:hypothetical protein
MLGFLKNGQTNLQMQPYNFPKLMCSLRRGNIPKLHFPRYSG